MDIKEVARLWVEMWEFDLDSEERRKYDWIHDLEFQLTWKEPDRLIDLVLEILMLNINDHVKGLLAAGPLEQVLADHGAQVIKRVESLAAENEEFAGILGGVWKNSMSDDVWLRVQKSKRRPESGKNA